MDLYFDRVSLLLPMLGANNGITFQDWSPCAQLLTRWNDTKTLTARSKFYGSSGYFDGSGDYISVLPGKEFDFGAGDFTLEAWVYPTNARLQGIVCQRELSESSHAWTLALSGDRIWFEHGGVNGTTLVSMQRWVTVTMNAWHHVAAARRDGVIRLFLNGVKIGADAADATVLFSSAIITPLIGRLGTAWSGADWTGYLQDVRVTKGVARYTDNFTPPAALIGKLAGTVQDATAAFVLRSVHAWPKFASGAGARETISNAATGAFELIVPRIPHDVQVVATDGDGCDIWMHNRTPVAF